MPSENTGLPENARPKKATGPANSNPHGTGDVISTAGRCLLKLHLAAHVGPIIIQRLLDHFPDPDAIMRQSASSLKRIPGIGPSIAEAIVQAGRDPEADLQIREAGARNARITCLLDHDYPRPLRRTPDPPACLFVKGTLEPTDAVALAIVGTRHGSHYGREQAMRFARSLGYTGFSIVSGLARGIDACAHRGALAAGARTLAVLGCGLDTVYPPEHRQLAEEITSRGALVSEYPFQTAPHPKNFPRRNRLIAGLTLGVLVVEAGRRSGACITARLANEYGREVFAIPGRIDQPDVTAGTNALIRDGHAKLTTDLADILDELGDVGRIMAPRTTTPTNTGTSTSTATLPAAERAVISALRNGTDLAEDITTATGLTVGEVCAALTSLQIKGIVQRTGPDRYGIRRTRDEPA